MPALLYLTHRLPYPPDKGDRIRTFHILRYLAGRASVHLAALADEPVPDGALQTLRSLCAAVAVVPLGRTRWLRAAASFALGSTVSEGAFRSPELSDLLRDWGARTRFDACLASASSVAPYLCAPGLAEVPAVVDLIDVDSQKWLDYAAASRGLKAWLYRTEGQRLRQLERRVATWARALTVVSSVEADIFRGFCPERPVHVVTNGVDLDYFRPVEQVEEPACVFVGALDYKPNVDGVCWFSREVWPTIQQGRPGTKFYVVGRKPTAAVERLAGQPGVEVVGQVPDVRPWVARSAVAVVPLHIARGVQNKVLEALAMAKATVASPRILAGVRATPGTHLLAAESPAEWVEAVQRLLDNEALRRQLGSAGRRYVEEHHSWERCLQPLMSLLGLRTES